MKRLIDLFDDAFSKSDIADRGRFDSLMKGDEKNCPKPVLADLLYEVIQLTKEVRCLNERVDEIEENY